MAPFKEIKRVYNKGWEVIPSFPGYKHLGSLAFQMALIISASIKKKNEQGTIVFIIK